MVVKLDRIFDSFSKQSIFKNKNALQSNYAPETIPHRDDQIEQIAAILAPSLRPRLERPSNLFLYGKTGTGKTLSVEYIKSQLLERAKKQKINLSIISINCKLKKVADTEYRILAELLRQLGEMVPATGLPSNELFRRFVESIDKERKLVILIFDEIDEAVEKIGDKFLYNFTRLNTELRKAQISIIGISNNLTFLDNIDPRVRSSLSEEEVLFPPYDAKQLQDILKERAREAFKEKIDEGVIAKCAAFAAKGHGDARRALDLLRVAGELAERESKKEVSFEHIDKANEKIEHDKILDFIATCPEHYKLVFHAIMQLAEKREKFFTSEVYAAYKDLCTKIKEESRTQRRIGDIIREFRIQGLIDFRVISRGRYGRTDEIKLKMYPYLIIKAKEILKESLDL